MSEPPSKRARANTAGATTVSMPPDIPEYDIPTAVESLDIATTQEILATIAAKHRSVAQQVRQHYHKIVLEEQSRVIEFDHYSGSVWRQINIDHRGLRAARKYEAAFEVSASVECQIREIVEQVYQHSSRQTKENALATLRKIGKTICLSKGTVGREVRNQFQVGQLADAMGEIVDLLSAEDAEDLARSEFGDKFEELVNLSEGRCVHEGLREVLEDLDGEDPDNPGKDPENRHFKKEEDEEENDDNDEEAEEAEEEEEEEEGWGGNDDNAIET